MYTPSRQRCLFLLQNCKSSLPINHVIQIHSQLISNGLTQSPSIVARLIECYSASSSPHAINYARLIIAQFHNRFNPYHLNVLIRCSPPRDSILVFANWVSKETLNFDDFTYIFVLGACARLAKALWEGSQIHCRLIKHGFLSNVMLQTTLIHFYVNHHSFVYAKKVFDEMPLRRTATWNSLIAGYCSRQEHARDGLLLFLDMFYDYGVKPNGTTMVCVLSAVSRLGYLETGVSIHGYISKTMCDIEHDVYLGTGLVDMYAKCGCLDTALTLFMRMGHKNVLTWTAMVSGLAVHGLLKEGLSLFNDMKTKFDIVPRSYHYGCIVDLLGRVGYLNEAYEFIMSEKVEGDEVLWRSLLHACRVHNDIVMGEIVAKILISIHPDTNLEDYVAWSNICASNGRWEDVAAVREVINDEGVENKPAVSTIFA